MTRRILPHAPGTTLDGTVLAEGEVAIDETKNQLRIGDGVTPGGLKGGGADDGASGALWSTVQGFIDYLRALGARVVGYFGPETAPTGSVAQRLSWDVYVTDPQFGAVGDGPTGTDNATALAAAVTYVNSLCNNTADSIAVARRPRLIFPPGLGFRSSVGLEVNLWVDIIMQSPLYITAEATEEIVGIWHKDFKGVDLQAARDNQSVIDVRRITQSDWESENDIGYLNDGGYVSKITIKRCDGFCVPFRICAAYGDIWLGDIRDGKKSIIAAIGDPEQFTNHLHVWGGAFAPAGANPGKSRYGIEILGVAPYGANTILLDGQSYELGLTTAQTGNPSGEAVPLLVNGTSAAINSVRAINQRSEFNSQTLVRVTGAARNVEVGWLDAELEYAHPTSVMVDNQSTLGGAVYAYRHDGANAPQWKTVFATGPLVEKAVQLTGSVITVQNLEAASNVGAAPATQTFAYGDSGPSFDADGFMTNGGPLFGNRFRLNGERAIAVRGTKKSGAALDIRVLCFAADGSQIYAEGAARTEQSNAVLNTGVYGGLYTVSVYPSNTATQFHAVIQFASTVAVVFVAVSSPTKGYEVCGLNGAITWFSATSHLQDQFVGDAIPIALANVSYKRGMVVHKINAGSGAPDRWICSNPSTPTFLATANL